MTNREENEAFDRVTRIVAATFDTSARIGSAVVGFLRTVDRKIAGDPDEFTTVDNGQIHRGLPHDYLPDVNVGSRAKIAGNE